MQENDIQKNFYSKTINVDLNEQKKHKSGSNDYKIYIKC